MSFSITSPSLTPASKPAATISNSSSDTTISMVTAGLAAAKDASRGPERNSSAIEVTAIFRCPRGPLSKRTSSHAASIVDSGTDNDFRSRSPASVRFTERVVRMTSRVPNVSSRRLIPWLTADRVTPRRRRSAEAMFLSDSQKQR